MLEACALECIRGCRRLFSNLSFSIQPGDYFELTGPNGSGKTSLLRLLCGLLPPASGAVLWSGEPIAKNRERYLESLMYVGHRNALKDEMTALENLLVSSAMSGLELSRQEAQHALMVLNLGEYENVCARYLSEGQRRRLALARLVNCGRPLWLLDEITTSVDAHSACTIAALVDSHISSGGMAVIATHHALKLRSRSSQRIELAA